MSVGSVVSAGAPIALPLNRSPIQAVNRVQPSPEKKAASANAPNPASSVIASGSADPNRGKNLNILA
jgi:hypothetical protein